MQTEFEYYYNNVPGKGLCRNNLIYTSLISKDQKTFCQWYHNDTEYHRGQNEVVNANLMEEKFNREVEGLLWMDDQGFSDLIPAFDIDLKHKKIYLEIDGPDMWERAGCQGTDYSAVVPDWEEQMLNILKAHRELGMYKFSLHPSSYFVVDGKLKSINYFFSYFEHDAFISPASVMSHISQDRRKELFPKMQAMGIEVHNPYPFKDLQILAFESFKNNFSNEVMEKAKSIYV